MSIFKVKDICAGYGKNIIVKSVSFETKENEFIGIVGLNGSGKTTLLKALLNLIPHTGSCEVDGKEVKEYKPKELARKINYIPQKSGIEIDISVLDVVLMGFNPRLKMLEQPSEKMVDEAKSALAEVGLLREADSNFLELSEGQKQLCILARAFVGEASVMVMDEPESALDFNNRFAVMKMVKEHVQKNRLCALVTLHDLSLALNLCDKILLVNEGSLSDIIDLDGDSISSLEDKLSKVFGSVTVTEVFDKSGVRKLVVVKNEE